MDSGKGDRLGKGDWVSAGGKIRKRHIGSSKVYGPGSQQMLPKCTLTHTLLVASLLPPISQTYQNFQEFASSKKKLRSTVIWLKEHEGQKTS